MMPAQTVRVLGVPFSSVQVEVIVVNTMELCPNVTSCRAAIVAASPEKSDPGVVCAIAKNAMMARRNREKFLIAGISQWILDAGKTRSFCEIDSSVSKTPSSFNERNGSRRTEIKIKSSLTKSFFEVLKWVRD